MSKYLNECLPEVTQNGRKAKRLGWPKDKFITDVGSEKLTITLGKKTLTPANTLILWEKGKGQLGFVPTVEENNSHDWELIPA